MITTLRIKKKYETKIDVAIKYYSILSIINNLGWSPLDIKILAFTALEGSISSGGKRERFCELFNSTKNTVYNYTGLLEKAGYLIKKEKKIVLHPQLSLPSSTIILNITLENGEEA